MTEKERLAKANQEQNQQDERTQAEARAKAKEARRRADLDLPRGGTILSRDPRLIRIVSWDDQDQSSFSVGRSGVTEIMAYDENGEMALVPWVAILQGDEIYARAPAYQVTVVYYRPGEREGRGR